VLNKYPVPQRADFSTCHKKRARAIPGIFCGDKTGKRVRMGVITRELEAAKGRVSLD